MYLFIDTKTTHKIDQTKDWNDPSQPYITQLDMILTDKYGSPKSSAHLLIRCVDWEISTEAQMAWGITKEDWISLSMAMTLFWRLHRAARMIIAHNVFYDIQMIRCMSYRLKLNVPILNTFCTMKAMAPVLKLPGTNGYKWPSLEESVKELPAEHQSPYDTPVESCKKLFFHLQFLSKDPLQPNGPT